ncbi:MAG: cytochrome ubiquinol oxidase subunit, partial [Paenibacillus sp.]|nr:cytochrome ubiquinol oxidase subunit [Paenibacillus sp.]
MKDDPYYGQASCALPVNPWHCRFSWRRSLSFSKLSFWGFICTLGIDSRIGWLISGCLSPAIAAWSILKGRNHIYYKKALKLTMVSATVFLISTALIGDLSGKYLAKYQPEKLAAMEWHFETTRSGNVEFLFAKLFKSTYSWSVVLLAIVSVLYISAMFLSYYADKTGDRPAFELVRKYALAWSLPAPLY